MLSLIFLGTKLIEENPSEVRTVLACAAGVKRGRRGKGRKTRVYMLYGKPLLFENFKFSSSEKKQSPGPILAECHCEIDSSITQN